MDAEPEVSSKVILKDKAIELLKLHEGYSDKLYKDTKGIWTIGYGWNIQEHGLPEHINMQLLEIGIDTAIKDLDVLIPWWRNLDENRQAALIDMSYNMGRRVLSQFKKGSLELIRQGNYKQAAANLRKSAWAKQTKSRAVRITKIIETGEL